MNLPKIVFAAIIFIGFYACTKKVGKLPQAAPDEPQSVAPRVCFQPSKRFIALGDSIRFQNCSANYDKAEWLFGDGGSSTKESPVHIFNTKGLYKVSLLAHNGRQTRQLDTTIVCGMKASVTVTVDFSEWKPASFPNTKYMYAETYLLKASDTLFPIAWLAKRTYTFKDYLTASSIVGSAYLPDENTDYCIKTSLYYVTIYEMNGADFVQIHNLGTLTSKRFRMFDDPGTKRVSKTGFCTLSAELSKVTFN